MDCNFSENIYPCLIQEETCSNLLLENEIEADREISKNDDSIDDVSNNLQPETETYVDMPPDFFIFQDFWLIMKIFSFLGIFPWKKINENGSIQLQYMKCSSRMTFLFWFLSFSISWIGLRLQLPFECPCTKNSTPERQGGC